MSAARLLLTVYLGERDRGARGMLADELVGAATAPGIEASVLLRGIEGFGSLHDLRTERLLSAAENLPAVAIVTGEPAAVEALAGRIHPLVRRGLVTLERAGRSLESLPGEGAVKLTVFVGRGERAGGTAAFAAACERLHAHGVEGATVLGGVDGTRRGERQRARLVGRGAAVPAIVLAVGAEHRIAAALAELAPLLADPPVTLERVRVCKRDGETLAAPHDPPGADEAGRARWQKLTVHSSQATLVAGRSLHVELIRRLHEDGAGGATAIRGVWGYHGEHRPHGDRLLQIRRHVPVLTHVLETPERAARTYAIVDEVTATSGLVTSEIVPALARGGAGPLELAGPPR